MSWQPYYEKTEKKPPDPTLEFAHGLVNPTLPKLAIDCGCGAGRNAEFLRTLGFKVFGFDHDPDAIEICRKRFSNDEAAHFACDTFLSFDYPKAALTVAMYSLFFCPAHEFEGSWRKISTSLLPGGVFCGTFLGPKDSWTLGGGAKNGTIPVVSHSIEEVRALFDEFEIARLDERDFDGMTAMGTEKHWHSFTVVARRNQT